MLIFVVPLKSPEVANCWRRVCQLFERTVRSLCHQTSNDFKVIVVCHGKPDINFSHPNVIYLEVDFPLPKHKNRIARGDTDKGRKIFKGLIHAKEFSPSHTMIVDADDCVSRRLAEFVSQHHESNGWFVNCGYKYQENSPYIYLKQNNFYRMCGSCNILRYDLNFLPENPEYNRGYGYYKYCLVHAKVKEVLAEKHLPIQPLPFLGAVYVINTGDNISGNENKLNFHWLNRRKLTTVIQEEFGLYPLDLK